MRGAGAVDGMFSNEISNTLQYITFPLEVVGLTLAAIEVRFPNVARRIEAFLELSGLQLKTAQNGANHAAG